VPEDERRPLVFVATGTGFAPVKSVLDDLLKRGLPAKTTVIWGARSAEGLYMMSTARAWQARSPDVQFIPAISGSPDPSVGDAFAGRVDAALQAHFPSLHGHSLYCCGSPEMTKSVFAKAVELGLAAADFHADAFVGAGEHAT
jgi:CDP-4-dehydro-6-deoxyglucose reductase/terephthalate 1,2-dioxygenase reductase component